MSDKQTIIVSRGFHLTVCHGNSCHSSFLRTLDCVWGVIQVHSHCLDFAFASAGSSYLTARESMHPEPDVTMRRMRLFTFFSFKAPKGAASQCEAAVQMGTHSLGSYLPSIIWGASA